MGHDAELPSGQTASAEPTTLASERADTTALSLRDLRKLLEDADDVARATELLLANTEVGVGRAQRSMGPRAVCALITQLGRAKQCDKVRGGGRG
jgi:hypothetical protein